MFTYILAMIIIMHLVLAYYWHWDSFNIAIINVLLINHVLCHGWLTIAFFSSYNRIANNDVSNVTEVALATDAVDMAIIPEVSVL